MLADQLPVHDVRDAQRQCDRNDGGCARIHEGIQRCIARQVVLKDGEVQVVQRHVVQRETASPGLSQRSLADDNHRHEKRQRADAQTIAEHRPLPAAQGYQPTLATLARQNGVTFATGDAPLQPEQQHRDAQQRHRISRCDTHSRRVLEELPQLGRHHMESAWQCQQCGGTEERNGFQEHQDEGPQNRWHHQRKCDGQGRAQATGAKDVRGILHFRRDEIER